MDDAQMHLYLQQMQQQQQQQQQQRNAAAKQQSHPSANPSFQQNLQDPQSANAGAVNQYIMSADDMGPQRGNTPQAAPLQQQQKQHFEAMRRQSGPDSGQMSQQYAMMAAMRRSSAEPSGRGGGPPQAPSFNAAVQMRAAMSKTQMTVSGRGSPIGVPTGLPPGTTPQQAAQQYRPLLATAKRRPDMPTAAVRPDAASFFQRPSNFAAPHQQGGNAQQQSWPGGSPDMQRAMQQQQGQAMSQQQYLAAQRQQVKAAGGPQHQMVGQLLEKMKAEKEKYLGVERKFERSRKRPLYNEEKAFWDIPLSARLIAGISLLEADASLTQGHHMGGATDLWAALDPMPSPMSCSGGIQHSAYRFGGAESYRMGAPASMQAPQEYLYTQCSLMGVVDENDTPEALPALLQLLQSLSDVCQRGMWKDECWRIDQEPARGLTFLQSQGKCARELWIRRYMLPEHLRNVFALRIYSAEYLAVPPSFPTNARKIKEATVSPSIVTIIDGIGFQRAPPNDIYVKGQIYHIDAGTSRHVMVVCKKFYTSRYMNEEMFPKQIFVEAIARSERHSQLMPMGQILTELAQKLEPHVHLMKV